MVLHVFGVCLISMSVGLQAEAADSLSLQQTIERALQVNLQVMISREDLAAASAARKSQRTEFWPTLGTEYQFLRNDEAPNIGGFTSGSEDEYAWTTSVTQPLFTGFALTNQYALTQTNVALARLDLQLVRQDIILTAKETFFSLLKAQKLLDIAEATVKQIDAQKKVAQDFYEVGMSPLNDLLQAQVELANAKQDLIRAQNDVDIAQSNFNLVLRQPLPTVTTIEDIRTYVPFTRALPDCQQTAEQNRLELKIADTQVQREDQNLALVKKDYYPNVNLQGTYFRRGDDWDVDGGDGVFDPDGWRITAIASWDFWQWGRTRHDVTAQLKRVARARLDKTRIMEQLRLEVREAYLRTNEAQKNITTVEKAIAQARENFRINEERYQAQVATSTDVLDAQTLLARTMINYFNALYDFKIAKARLQRAMGVESMGLD